MPPFLGFGFSGYRSVGDELVLIAPLNKINLIIGQNNSGKSNIINFLKHGLPNAVAQITNATNPSRNFSEIDKHISGEPTRHRITFPIPLTIEHFKKNFYTIQECEVKKVYALWLKLLTSEQFTHLDTHAFVTYEAADLNFSYELHKPVELNRIMERNEWNILWKLLLAKPFDSNNDLSQWITEILFTLANKHVPLLKEIPPIEIIPAIRKIGEAGSVSDDFSGLGIIDRLAQLQNPDNDQSKKLKFEAINCFLREVLDKEKVWIEIPYSRDKINVYMDGKVLPLSSLGTGIHEVIILASAATLLENSILCVEEPELHLHPLLQRKLIQYLASNKTSNQYIFTTHSAHLLDTEDTEIFHVRNIDGKTTVEAISSTKDKSRICHDLGYKASDILQANCLIWVEGPSDRIYLKFWLESVDETLVKGIHYSIMFFGGRLFSHITANDNEDMKRELNDFISVRNLNRHSCIFFDSDKDKFDAEINETKKRLKEEFDEGEGFAWVTAGRETENYVNPDHIEECVKEVHSSALGIISKDKWANTLKYKSSNHEKGKKIPTANKVEVARRYVANNYAADLSVYDLKQQIEKLRTFIYKANNLKVQPKDSNYKND